MKPRTLDLLPVPTGSAILALLEPLQQALSGVGPALLPVPMTDPNAAARVATALQAGKPLLATEDDPSDPTALVIATSGSTGAPKGALLSVNALDASAVAATRRLTKAADPQWLLALPAHHISGMNVLIRAARGGSVPQILDTADSFTAERFIQAVSSMTSGARLVSLVPTQLQRLLAVPEAVAALATFDSVLIGGAALPGGQLDRARAAGVNIVISYGMSETCGGCLYDGVPLDGVHPRIDNRAGGRIVLTGPMVARGYRGQPGHPSFVTETTPTGKMTVKNRTFRTDDIGRFTPTGQLEVIGRLDDIIITGGAKIAPIAVETVLAAVPGVRDVVITSIPDEEWGRVLVAVVVVDNGGPLPTLASLRSAASFALGTIAAPRHLLLVDEFPYRGPGKHDRAALAALAAHTLT